MQNCKFFKYEIEARSTICGVYLSGWLGYDLYLLFLSIPALSLYTCSFTCVYTFKYSRTHKNSLANASGYATWQGQDACLPVH